MSQLLRGFIRVEQGLQIAALIGVMLLLGYVGWSQYQLKEASSAPRGVPMLQDSEP
ncbi:hypothetical protein [Leptolyngbya iicbica]|uniref:Uncharacterized protein n=1 Tax=Lyngbya confervoides BDU141951 TaxID=1574623 RepID=A0A8T6QP62_9CYAN|nr:hypothetical protein [Leptolyngbya sp. LK]